MATNLLDITQGIVTTLESFTEENERLRIENVIMNSILNQYLNLLIIKCGV